MICETHQAIRRYFEGKLDETERTQAHKLAVLYYSHLRAEGRDDVMMMSEHLHHLVMAGEKVQAEQFRLVLYTEMMPAARKIYQEKDYGRALELYQTLLSVNPDQSDVLAYVGRCFARIGNWTESDSHFDKAAETCRKKGSRIHWVYRDWGHMKARYGFFESARELFSRAHELKPGDPSTLAGEAYVASKCGELVKAAEYYEAALKSDSHHEYSLTNYIRFLETQGNDVRAASLRLRLGEIEQYSVGEDSFEFYADVEPEYDD